MIWQVVLPQRNVEWCFVEKGELFEEVEVEVDSCQDFALSMPCCPLYFPKRQTRYIHYIVDCWLFSYNFYLKITLRSQI